MLIASRDITDSGYSALRMSEIESYFSIYEVRGVETRDYFIKMIKALDVVYTAHMNAKLREEMKKKQQEAKLKGKGKHRK